VPDYPPEVHTLATDAVAECLQSWGLPTPPGLVPRLASDVLARIAAALGDHAAQAILEHAERQHPRVPGHVPDAWHRHFSIAARVAARAFLTEEDTKRMAAEALMRGGFAACAIPEVPAAIARTIYCRGCRKAWREDGTDECRCTCTNPGDLRYEDWTADPDPADIAPGAWD
jgi:hypothetical protein